MIRDIKLLQKIESMMIALWRCRLMEDKLLSKIFEKHDNVWSDMEYLYLLDRKYDGIQKASQNRS